jgi:calcium and integrin-binding protein 1
MEDVKKVLLHQVGKELTEDELVTAVRNIFEEVDIDGDDKLSFMEFDHVIARCPDFTKYVGFGWNLVALSIDCFSFFVFNCGMR